MNNIDYNEELKREEEAFLQCCGSCLHFVTFMAESGFCKIADCNCLCENPKAMIDIWDEKCEKWVKDDKWVND